MTSANDYTRTWSTCLPSRVGEDAPASLDELLLSSLVSEPMSRLL
jgi:hypothetical protein